MVKSYVASYNVNIAQIVITLALLAVGTVLALTLDDYYFGLMIIGMAVGGVPGLVTKAPKAKLPPEVNYALQSWMVTNRAELPTPVVDLSKIIKKKKFKDAYKKAVNEKITNVVVVDEDAELTEELSEEKKE